MKRWIVATGVGILHMACATSGLAESAELTRAKSVYTERSAALEKRYQEQVTVAEARYVSGLETLSQQAQTRGQLEELKAVKAEQARAGANPVVTQGDIVAQPASLRSFQESYHAAMQGYADERDDGIVELTQKYLAHLQGQKQALTQQGNLVAAQEMADESARVDLLPAYRSALFAQEERAAAESGPAAAAPAAASSLPPIKTSPGVTVHPAGRMPPSSGSVFHAETMRSTLTGAQPLVMRVKSRLLKDSEKSGNTGAVVASSKRSRTESLELQIGVSSSSSQSGQSDLLIATDYYGKDVSGNAGPQKIATTFVRLQDVDTRSVYASLPPVELSHSSVEWEVRKWGGASDGRETGMTFEGVVVTVFGADGERVYQGVSAAGLTSFAPEGVEAYSPGEKRAAAEATRAELDLAIEALARDPQNPALRARVKSLQRELGVGGEAVGEPPGRRRPPWKR